MNNYRGISLKLCMLLLTGLFAFANVSAQDSDAEKSKNVRTKKAQAVSKEVYDDIIKAQELVDEEEDYQGALKILNKLYDPEELSEYEQANVLNYMGFVHYNIPNMSAAISAFQKLLAIPSIEPQMAKQTTFTVAQLLTVEERYEDALNTIDEWFVLETNPGPDPFILKAQIHYNLNQYESMIKPIEDAMEVANKREIAIKEDWWGLLNFAYFQQENYLKVRDIQKILLQTWPKKRYWQSLAGAFTELGEDEKLIYAYDAAYTQGMLDKGSEFVTMSQLFLQAEVPYKAATLLEEKMNAGIIEKNAKHYRLLSQSWMLAMEDKKAIPALKEAARLSDDGEVDARLANSYLNIGEYSNCVQAAKTALKKGDIRSSDNVQITLGMCLYNIQNYSDAKAAFKEAAKVSKSRRTSNQWIRVIDAEVERNRQIQLAEEAAKKKREEIEARKARNARA